MPQRDVEDGEEAARALRPGHRLGVGADRGREPLDEVVPGLDPLVGEEAFGLQIDPLGEEVAAAALGLGEGLGEHRRCRRRGDAQAVLGVVGGEPGQRLDVGARPRPHELAAGLGLGARLLGGHPEADRTAVHVVGERRDPRLVEVVRREEGLPVGAGHDAEVLGVHVADREDERQVSVDAGVVAVVEQRRAAEEGEGARREDRELALDGLGRVVEADRMVLQERVADVQLALAGAEQMRRHLDRAAPAQLGVPREMLRPVGRGRHDADEREPHRLRRGHVVVGVVDRAGCRLGHGSPLAAKCDAQHAFRSCESAGLPHATAHSR